LNKWTITKHELSRSLTTTFAAHHGAYFVTIFVEPLHKDHERPQASICFCNFRKLSVWPQITILERSWVLLLVLADTVGIWFGSSYRSGFCCSSKQPLPDIACW